MFEQMQQNAKDVENDRKQFYGDKFETEATKLTEEDLKMKPLSGKYLQTLN